MDNIMTTGKLMDVLESMPDDEALLNDGGTTWRIHLLIDALVECEREGITDDRCYTVCTDGIYVLQDDGFVGARAYTYKAEETGQHVDVYA